jgi:hypothetical protein
MSTTRIVNGVEYVVPPGTEHTWTPPEQIVVTPSDPTYPALDTIRNLRVQGLVRNQNQEKIQGLTDKCAQIYQSFLDKKINAQQLADQLAHFRNNDLTSNSAADVDDITVQNFEFAILQAISESTK